jgi:uncharacterized protein YndB with AHSA1/START domain
MVFTDEVGAYRLTVRVAAPREGAFDLWTNLDRIKEWVGGVTRVTDVTGPVDQAGTRYTVWFGGMRSQTEVLDAERPVWFRTRFGNRILRGENSPTFVAEGDGTRVIQEFRTEGWIAAIAARLSRRARTAGSFQGGTRSAGWPNVMPRGRSLTTAPIRVRSARPPIRSPATPGPRNGPTLSLNPAIPSDANQRRIRSPGPTTTASSRGHLPTS